MDQLCEWVDARRAGELVGAAGQLGLVLARLLDRELRGCFDGPTTVGTGAMTPAWSSTSPPSTADDQTLRLAALATIAWLETAVAARAGGERSVQASVGCRSVAAVCRHRRLPGSTHWRRAMPATIIDPRPTGSRGSWHRALVAAVRPPWRWAARRPGDGTDARWSSGPRCLPALSTTRSFRLSVPGDVALTQSALRLSLEEAGLIAHLARAGGVAWRARAHAVSWCSTDIGPDEWVFCDGPHALTV